MKAIFTGAVKTVPNGFGFIDINTVRREGGDPHGLETTADIFVPQPECTVVLKVGLVLRFSVEPDARRGVGNFKAVQATELIEAALIPASGPVMPGFHWSLVTTMAQEMILRNGQPHPHDRMKEVDPEVVKQVGKNSPLEGVPGDDQEVHLPDNPAGIEEALSRYLYSLHPT